MINIFTYMKKLIFILLIPSIVYSQDTVKIVTYNLLNYDDDIDRNNYFKLIIFTILTIECDYTY